jgi:cytochrome c-type biogenesis protein CcmH
MTMIVAVLALGSLVWLLLAWNARKSRSEWMPLGVAVMIGLTGYLFLGSPGVASAPVAAPARDAGFGDAIDDPRMGLTTRRGDTAMWLGFADGLMRGGNMLGAAQVLQQGLRQHPRSVDLWVGYGNALVAHSGGVMTPAAAMAFDRAADIDPSHPAPPFFAGLSLAQGGDLVGARAVWQELLNRSPPDAPWREDLTNRLAQLPPAPTPATPTPPPSSN